MTLSDEQIERYSRQIVLSAIGGRGQERLLASRLKLVAAPEDLQPALAYMVGAGVGSIILDLPAVPDDVEETIAAMHALNADANVSVGNAPRADGDLTLVLAGSTAAIDAARLMSRAPVAGPLVLARLDSPGRIAIIRESPPCVACADAQLLAPFGERTATARLIAMAACVETFKLLARCSSTSRATIVEFKGYESVAREAKVSDGTRCRCARG